MSELTDLVRASYQRAITQNQKFFEQFYENLFSRRSEYREMFGETDMVHQYARLYAGIQKLIEYAENPVPEALNLVASIHHTRTLTLDHKHYLDWVDSLLDTLSKSDSEFGPDIADKWVTVIMPGIEFMKNYRP